MSKRWLLSFFLISLISCVASAQMNVEYDIHTLKNENFSEEFLSLYASNKLGLPCEAELIHRSVSPAGEHRQYQIYTSGFPLYNHLLLVHLASDKVFLRYPNHELNNPKFQAARQASVHAKADQFLDNIWYDQHEWVAVDSQWQLLEVAKGLLDGESSEIIIDWQGKIISVRDLGVHKRDSTGVGLVFNPDPLTSSNTEYGDVYADNDDSNANIDQYEQKDIPIAWNESKNGWVLASKYSMAVDDVAPFTGTPVSDNGQFNFNRSDSNFEYVNAHYHINHLRTHIDTIGFDSLANYSIPFDAHVAFNPADQSRFQPATGGRSQLQFGIGGVDDAEDADVVIHEYGHALSYSAAPATNIGFERRALDEAFGDYLAFSYSNSISTDQSKQIFNWDGHNEFWSGRIVNDTRTYPSNIEEDIYLDAPIFSSAMADVHDALGREIADVLYITSLYSYFPDMKMTDAAELIIQTDSLLYNGQHQNTLEILFCLRGLLEDCLDTLVNGKPLIAPYIGNMEAFASGVDRLILYSNGNSMQQYSVYDLSGNLVFENKLAEEQALFTEIDFLPEVNGMYILVVGTTSGTFSFKIIRY